jgi:GAF domain-containing protein
LSDLPAESTERLTRVMKLVRTQRTLPTKLEAVTELVKRTIANCDAAGVSLMVEQQPTTCVITDHVVVEVDLVQYETSEGPCLAAIEESNVVRIDVIEEDVRFSRFAPGALDSGINSVLSLPLVAEGRTVGALNLYSYRPNAFDQDSERAAIPFADYAAEVIARSPLYAYSLDMVEGLIESIENQALISRATGVLVARHGWSSAEALDALRRRALAHGESLLAVAESILAETAEPGPPR